MEIEAGVNLNIRSGEGSTALKTAAKSNYLEIAKALIATGRFKYSR